MRAPGGTQLPASAQCLGTACAVLALHIPGSPRQPPPSPIQPLQSQRPPPAPDTPPSPRQPLQCHHPTCPAWGPLGAESGSSSSSSALDVPKGFPPTMSPARAQCGWGVPMLQGWMVSPFFFGKRSKQSSKGWGGHNGGPGGGRRLVSSTGGAPAPQISTALTPHHGYLAGLGHPAPLPGCHPVAGAVTPGSPPEPGPWGWAVRWHIGKRVKTGTAGTLLSPACSPQSSPSGSLGTGWGRPRGTPPIAPHTAGFRIILCKTMHEAGPVSSTLLGWHRSSGATAAWGGSRLWGAPPLTKPITKASGTGCRLCCAGSTLLPGTDLGLCSRLRLLRRGPVRRDDN